MRKSSRGKHGIPEGGLFRLVSCPHYLSEILIYTVLMLVRNIPYLILGVSGSTRVVDPNTLIWPYLDLDQIFLIWMFLKLWRKKQQENNGIEWKF